MIWYHCPYCAATYAHTEFHSCPPTEPHTTQELLDLQLDLQLPLAPALPKIYVSEDFMYDTIHVEIYVPKTTTKYAARFTREFIAMTSLNSIYHKTCELFEQAIKDDENVRQLIRNAVLGKEFANISYAEGGYVSGNIGNYPLYDGLSRHPEIDHFPGMKAEVKYPGNKPTYVGLTMSLEHAIIHLNDFDKWTREQIADWLETLDVDIRFKTKENDDEQVG